ncbi:hypothetical protein UFOVP191_11 [uncultured Caudovirales phage]|uniref:Uncharacterized protein n=1 Tax=uncultured Caudovirales phage TaxID=2100421 RepID=A0A6J7WG70_9CAUD|nr:hypothetical protein UFOVP191_11 [uncultured Caudovirales phage]
MPCNKFVEYREDVRGVEPHDDRIIQPARAYLVASGCTGNKIYEEWCEAIPEISVPFRVRIRCIDENCGD